MKLTKSQLKQMIKEELFTERLKRFKVYVSGESEPLILLGKSEKEVKHTAHQMIQNSSVKIKKVVKEAMSRRIDGKTLKIPQPSDFNNDMEKYFDALNKHMKEVEKLSKIQKKKKKNEGKLTESGIMYRAGVKKYGKEGMTKIQQAAGRGEGHAEIGKIKDKYEKDKKEVKEEDNEGKMAKFDAKEVFQDAEDIFKMIGEKDDLPEWLEAKITIASHNMNAVKDYLTHHHSGTNEIKEDWSSKQPFSSPEAKKIMDTSLRDYAKQLRKVEHNVIKDWMTKAKAGVMDYFDVVNGLTQGDASRAHPEETEFLHKILMKDKILNRFRSYFGGKKGKPRGNNGNH